MAHDQPSWLAFDETRNCVIWELNACSYGTTVAVVCNLAILHKAVKEISLGAKLTFLIYCRPPLYVSTTNKRCQSDDHAMPYMIVARVPYIYMCVCVHIGMCPVVPAHSLLLVCCPVPVLKDSDWLRIREYSMVFGVYNFLFSTWNEDEYSNFNFGHKAHISKINTCDFSNQYNVRTCIVAHGWDVCAIIP